MIILQGITEQELLQKIEVIIEKKLLELVKPPKPDDKFLTRKEVTGLLHITLPTLDAWTKEGLIPSYRIGKRVLYKSADIDESITERKFSRFFGNR
jgi:excisionase family DNA binding protein